MAQTQVSIEPGTLDSVRALIDALEKQLEVDLVPGFLRTLDETLPLTSATFGVNTAKKQYELGIAFGVKIGEDNNLTLVMSWVTQETGGVWAQTPKLSPLNPRAAFSAPQELREGWLVLRRDKNSGA